MANCKHVCLLMQSVDLWNEWRREKPDELPDLELKAEIEAARAIRCPLHGERFSKLAPKIYHSRALFGQ